VILTNIAVSRVRVTAVALLALFIAGLQSYMNLPRAEDPGFTIRTAVVTVIFPGAGPERVERLVTARIEEEIQQIAEVDEISSLSTTGRSTVTVNLKDDVNDLQEVWDELRRKVEDAERDLPPEVALVRVDDAVGEVFGILVAVLAEGYADAERMEIAEDLKEALLALPEAASVEIEGDQPRRVFVSYRNATLASYGISPLYLVDILQKQNIVTPGGTVFEGREAITVQPSGSYTSLDELRATPIALPSGGLATLADLADVRELTVDPPEPRFRYRGEPAHLVAMSLRDGGNILQLGEDARDVLRDFRQRYPIGVEFEEVNFQPDDVSKKIDEFMESLLQAVAIVVFVMVLFLGLRTGFVVASLIPGAMVATFGLMSYFEVGIDQMSLAALLIALGMLVDNAIVMSENTLIRMQQGATALDASKGAAAELWSPLLVSSLTTAAAFLPFYLGQGGASEYVAPIFLVVTMTLLSSWFLAMTMIPMLTSYFLEPPSEVEDESVTFGTPGYRRYRAVITALLKRPWMTVVAATAALFLSLQGFGFIPAKFFPPSDKPAIVVELELAPGTRQGETERVVSELETWLAAKDGTPGIVRWGAMAGDGLPRFILTFSPPTKQPRTASLLLEATSRDDVDVLIPELVAHLDATFPELRATVSPLQMGPPVKYPVSFKLAGRDVDGLFEHVDALEAKMRETDGLFAIANDWGWRTKKLLVDTDPVRARLSGVTHQDVATSLLTGISGIEATSYRDGEDLVPVMVQSRDAEDLSLARVAELGVYPANGGPSVPLAQVADVSLGWENGAIRRVDRRRQVEIFAQVTTGYEAAALTAELAAWLEAESAGWDPQYSYEVGGESADSGEANAQIMGNLPISVLVITLLLVMQFDSVRRTFLNLVVLPYAFIGVTIGLLVTGSYFGFMTLLGIISLFGVVLNNANVLIDRIDTERAEGRAAEDAVVAAAQARLRPILLTTCTTVLGLIPLWLGGGPMFEPMAIVLIFGLVFGTVLTLGLVPVGYALLFRLDFAGRDYADGVPKAA
jgi:multidrug efflux pump subunit AcrB